MKTLLPTLTLACAALQAQQLNPNIVWGIGSDQGIWRVNTYDLTNPPWRRVDGPAGATLSQIAVAPDGSVFAVGADTRSANVWALSNGNTWRPTVFGVLASIAPAGARDIWGVTPNGQIQRWQPPAAGFDTIQTDFTAAQVATGGDGSVWALDTGGQIYFFNGTRFTTLSPGTLRRVAVAHAELAWGIAPDNTIWRWDGNNWISVPRPPDATPAQISVSPDGTAYLTDSNLRIYLRTGDTWRQMPGLLSVISAAPADRIFFDDPGITLSAGNAWTRQTNANAGAGGFLQTSKAGDSLTFKFTGDSISIHRYTDQNGGQADVTVDGRNAGTIDFFSPQPAWYVPAILQGFGAGEHTIVITANNRTSLTNQINIDSYCAPAPQVPTPAQTRALGLVNQSRARLGFPAAQANLALNVAAQAHARYISLNFITHDESQNMPGFTGRTPSDRANFFGFRFGVSETISNSPDPDECFNFWMDTIYHRTPLVNYSFNAIGFGAVDAGRRSGCSMSYSSVNPPPLRERLITTWPVDNQEGVPLDYTVDAPDPGLADPDTLGYVISLQVEVVPGSPTGNDNEPFSGTLTDANGRQVPVFLVTRDTVPAAHQNFMSVNYFVMIPRERLAPNTVYTVQMSGTDSRRFRFDRTWRFTSAPNSTVYLDRMATTPYRDGSTTAAVESEFWTAGPVDAANTSVVYGPSRRFGQAVQATPHPTIPNRFQFRIPSVPRGQPVFYQVIATDAQGKTSRSRVRTLTPP